MEPPIFGAPGGRASSPALRAEIPRLRHLLRCVRRNLELPTAPEPRAPHCPPLEQAVDSPLPSAARVQHPLVMLGSVNNLAPVHSSGHIHPAPHSLWGPGQPGPEGGFQRMMRAYELMVIIDGDVDDPKAQSFVKVVTDGITAAGGSIHGKPDWWGKRQSAYPINRKETGYYLVVEAVAAGGVAQRARAFAPYRGRGRPPQADQAARRRGEPPWHDGRRRLTGGLIHEKSRPWQKHRHPRRQRNPRSRAPLHQRRARRRQLRAGRQPAVPVQRRMAGADVLLRRRGVGHPRRERRCVSQQGHQGSRLRPPRAALLGDRERREADQDRSHRRRDRTQSALGQGRDREDRSHHRRRSIRVRPGWRAAAAVPGPGTRDPRIYGDEEPF